MLPKAWHLAMEVDSSALLEETAGMEELMAMELEMEEEMALEGMAE